MPVQLNVNSLGNIRLNESRIKRMLSGDREQALYMGFWDKFGDFFRGIGGHKKAEVLEYVWNLLNTDQTTPENSVQTEGDKLKRSVHIFNNLKELADSAHKDLFVIYMINDIYDVSKMKVDFTIDGTSLKTQFISQEDIDMKNVNVGNFSMKGADLRQVNLDGAVSINLEALRDAILPSNFLQRIPEDLSERYNIRFANEVVVNNKQIKNELLNETTGAGTRTAEAIPSEQLVEAGDLSEEPAYQELKVKDDGYCFFRCVLLQNTNDNKWAQCPAKEVHSETIKRYGKDIFKVLVNTFTYINYEMQLNFNNKNLAAVLENSANLLARTLTDEGGYFWSPKGICVCYDIDYDTLSSEDAANLEIFCDSAFTKLREALMLNMDKSKGSYATVEGVHYTWYKKLD
ncbi:TPA: hypothetical protein J6M74_004529 [Escherichia coli]|nr:hypothetical protein [Escherichia coli]